MILHVDKAEYCSEYRIRLRFNDGTSGQVDLRDHLTGIVFEPLRDKRQFRRFRVDSELGTIVWQNGADLAPEYLKSLVRTRPRRGAKPSGKLRRAAPTR